MTAFDERQNGSISVVENSIDKVASKRPQLDLVLGCGATGKTVLKQRYMSYPLSVSPIFWLDEQADCEQQGRAYLYRMNTSPGLLAGDELNISLRLEAGSSLLLADQAATKVHTMPTEGAKRMAKVNYAIALDSHATLEFFPEPLILYADSMLRQETSIYLHPSAGLSWGEIILPGRLARGEYYQFQSYWSRLKINDLCVNEPSMTEQQAWFVETMKLLGKNNPFAHSDLFAGGSVLGSLVLVLPKIIATVENLRALSQQIDRLSGDGLTLASSVLPGERGLFVRAIASTTRDLQSAFKSAANDVRELRGQPPLPYSL